MKKLALVFCFFATVATAAPINDFSFKSPAFNGAGYSSHALTIENQEFTRQAQVKKDLQAALDKAASDAKNTNISKFLNNLESRIYAQISQNVATAMFANGGTDRGNFVMQYQLDASGKPVIDPTTGKPIPITSIYWEKTLDGISMTVKQPGVADTTIVVPLGQFVIPGL